MKEGVAVDRIAYRGVLIQEGVLTSFQLFKPQI